MERRHARRTNYRLEAYLLWFRRVDPQVKIGLEYAIIIPGDGVIQTYDFDAGEITYRIPQCGTYPEREHIVPFMPQSRINRNRIIGKLEAPK